MEMRKNRHFSQLIEYFHSVCRRTELAEAYSYVKQSYIKAICKACVPHHFAQIHLNAAGYL